MNMESFIVVHGVGDQVVKVETDNGTVSKDTLRAAFQLKEDEPIGLFKNDVALVCRRVRNAYVFNLKGNWDASEFKIRLGELRRSCPVTPIEQGIHPKKRKIDPESRELPVDGDLAASLGKYALYYNVKKDEYKRSAIPITPRLAVTYRHGENKSIQIGLLVICLFQLVILGDEIVIRSWSDEKFEVSTRVVKIVEEMDTIILKSDNTNLCDEDLISNSSSPRKGMQYLLMGFSILHKKTSHLSLSTGIIVGDLPQRLRYMGSSGAFKGDSGGSCWSNEGELIGMQVQVQNVLHTRDEKGRPASPASGGRCCIVPMAFILSYIQDLLPPAESDGDCEWDEW